MGRGEGRTARAVLQCLRQSSSDVSGERLSGELGISRMAVSKAVAQLRAQGYSIESAPHRGYRLTGVTDLPVASAVQPLLRTLALGRAWVYENELPSTNRTAVALAAAGAPHGLVVTADAQSQGRGRMGRSWHSPAGRNLYVSIVLRPAVPAPRVPQISLLTALALCRALHTVCPTVPVAVKWPNDLWVGARKLAGILCEMDAEVDRVRHVVVGVGLNVNLGSEDLPGDLSERATSLRLEAGAVVPRPEVLAAFLNDFEPALDQWLRVDDLSPFLAELEAISVLQGRRIRVDAGTRVLEGAAAGIAPDGRLRLRLESGPEVLVSSGDAHVLAV